MATNRNGVDVETLKNQMLCGVAVIVTALAALCLDMPAGIAIPLGAFGGCVIGFSLVYFRIKNNKPKSPVGEES